MLLESMDLPLVDNRLTLFFVLSAGVRLLNRWVEATLKITKVYGIIWNGLRHHLKQIKHSSVFSNKLSNLCLNGLHATSTSL